MKFIRELVSCCVPSVGRQRVVRSRTEEKRSLMRLSSRRSSGALNEEEPPPPPPSLPCGKRGKLSGSKSWSATQTQWKPSLYAISEDKIFCVVVVGNTERTVRSDKKRAGKSKSKANKIRVRDYNDAADLRRSASMTAFPAFSPTAFLF
ncbi:hypothetical protein BVC80_8917g35 [Macleaya cordata]|uniref:Uncharacterized protein n=1 Tax=Macleaya cordata TaxID=56857 RepID=A0A200QRU7_MACCD|nr:hypothetical protein BVC80_8917g35 [Macleaya cordata]